MEKDEKIEQFTLTKEPEVWLGKAFEKVTFEQMLHSSAYCWLM